MARRRIKPGEWVRNGSMSQYTASCLRDSTRRYVVQRRRAVAVPRIDVRAVYEQGAARAVETREQTKERTNKRKNKQKKDVPSCTAAPLSRGARAAARTRNLRGGPPQMFQSAQHRRRAPRWRAPRRRGSLRAPQRGCGGCARRALTQRGCPWGGERMGESTRRRPLASKCRSLSRRYRRAHTRRTTGARRG